MTSTQIATKNDVEAVYTYIDQQIQLHGGVQGAQGAPGTPGTIIFNGTTDPSGAQGNNGDYYLRTDNHVLFGPKAGGSWPSGVSLVGPAGAQGSQGASGANGNTIISGTGAPGSVGNTNDYYLDTAAVRLYGPKASGGSWGSGVSLVGATGQAGPAGSNGTNGTNGSQIWSGTGPPSSGLGVNGDYYFDTTGKAIYGPKSGGAWPSGTSLQGATGAAGAAGAPGAAGTNGSTWYVGSGAPSSGTGVNGDLYFDSANGVFYGPKASGAWGSAKQVVTYNFISQPGSTTDYTLTDADNGKVYGWGSGTASNITIRIPSNLSADHISDHWMEGSGTLTFISDAGTSSGATGGAALHSRGVASTTSIHHPGFSDVATVVCRYNTVGGNVADCFIANGVT